MQLTLVMYFKAIKEQFHNALGISKEEKLGYLTVGYSRDTLDGGNQSNHSHLNGRFNEHCDSSHMLKRDGADVKCRV